MGARVTPRTFVVVGAGLAGLSAVSTLRSEGFDGRIVLVGAEPHLPYSRPPLSKSVLRGEDPPEKALLRPPSWYVDHAIDLELGVAATSLGPVSRTVELGDGSRIAYDALLLATGGCARALPVPGATLAGVAQLRTLDDALEIRDFLEPGAPVVVVGAGFIGAEVAASARMVGCEVTMLEIAPVPLGRALGDRVGAMYADIHRRRGVTLRTGVGVERIEGDDRVRRVVATDGTVHDAAVVVVGVGLAPATSLAAGAGLRTGDGVVVDERCRTSAPDIFAAGDIAEHPNVFVGTRVRLEHWQHAQHQAQAAARNMLGQRRPFHEVPWFWSDQFELNLQMVGLPGASDQTVVRGDVDTACFSVFYVSSDRLTGALAVNRPHDVRAARTMIRRGQRPDPAFLADEDTDLLALADRARA